MPSSGSSPYVVASWLVCQDPLEARRRKDVQTSVKQALIVSKKGENHEPKHKPSDKGESDSEEDEANFEARMRRQVLEKKSMLADSKTAGTAGQITGLINLKST